MLTKRSCCLKPKNQKEKTPPEPKENQVTEKKCKGIFLPLKPPSFLDCFFSPSSI